MSYREFPPFFADAETDLKDAEYVVYGVPYDRTGSFRQGAAEGPAAIRRAAWNNELHHLPTGQHTETWRFHDAGDVDVSNDDEPEAMVERTYRFAKRFADAGQIPILLGGEHNVPVGAVRALSERYDDLALVQIDAHLDYRDEFEGSRYSHANALRRFVDHVGPDNVAIIGVRSAEREELAAADRDGIHRRFTSFDVKERGIQAVLDPVLRDFADRPVYLTIDIDGIDPAYAPGTGTPEPFGLTDWDVLETIRRCAPRLIGMDVVEVCPPYDNGQTAMLASKLVREAIFWRENTKTQVPQIAVKTPRKPSSKRN